MTTSKSAILIPTYNERDNVEKLIKEIQIQGVDADLVFVDDKSPDGTGELLESLKTKYAGLIVLHREEKLGIGSAHQFGINWAYQQGYERLITMDCDFTHRPENLPILIAAAPDADIIVGSRYMKKGALSTWNFYRKGLTRLGHLVTVALLKMPYDATGAFRLYNLHRIPKYSWDTIVSQGYSFFFESLYVFHVNKFRISQIPIDLPARTYGHSKMRRSDVLNSLRFLVALYLTKIFNPEKLQIVETVAFEGKGAGSAEEKEWDHYWNNKYKTGRLIYDVIAAIYRKFIIRPTLNYFVRKHFRKGANVLHAGCGSGQVDVDIHRYIDITALDISSQALSFYQKTNKGAKILPGSIFDIPLPSHSIDGIYNLGVMEHFDQKDIRLILREFHRVLRAKGKMVIFWPPEFGLSVVFFKVLKFGFERILRKKNVKFHPDEISRVQSKKQVMAIFEECGFKVNEYYFGVKDFFTYSVIAVEQIPGNQPQPSKPTKEMPVPTEVSRANLST